MSAEFAAKVSHNIIYYIYLLAKCPGQRGKHSRNTTIERQSGNHIWLVEGKRHDGL